VQVQYFDDNSIVDGIPLDHVFIDIETDHTGVIDAGLAQAQNIAHDTQAKLAALSHAARCQNAPEARLTAAAIDAGTVDPPPGAPLPPVPRIVQHHLSGFVDWKATPFFFAKAFPTLFMPDKLGDPRNATIPAEFNPVCINGFVRQSHLKFPDWCEQLVHAADGRFVAHPTFMFAVGSIKQSTQARSCTTFAINCLPGDAPPDLAAVREALNTANYAGVDHLGHYITSYMNSVTGTAPYWWKRRREVADMLRFLSTFFGFLPVIFHTASFAEYYMPGLYKVLYESLILFEQPDLAEAIDHLRTRQGGPPSNPKVSLFSYD